MNASILNHFSVRLLVFWFKEPKLGSTAAGNETSEAWAHETPKFPFWLYSDVEPQLFDQPLCVSAFWQHTENISIPSVSFALSFQLFSALGEGLSCPSRGFGTWEVLVTPVWCKAKTWNLRFKTSNGTLRYCVYPFPLLTRQPSLCIERWHQILLLFKAQLHATDLREKSGWREPYGCCTV